MVLCRLPILFSLRRHNLNRYIYVTSIKMESEAFDKMKSLLPFFAYGKVVHGFGRGSKELGCPTANVSDEVVSELPESLPCAVYFGLASVDNGPVYRMVTSVGWNPQYKNTKRTLEVHILHNFESDFYGSLMKVAIMGYLRPMRAFPSLDALKEAIREDIEEANLRLDNPDLQQFSTNTFFTPGGEKKVPCGRKISDIIPPGTGDEHKSVS